MIFRRQSILLLLFVGVLVPLAKEAPAGAAGAHRAGVVVRGGDGQVHAACVSFDEPSISGLTLLERAGLDVNVQVSSGGATVCSIGREGCHFPNQACFCQCQGGSACRYWSYWHLSGGAWQYAATGASSYQVPSGGVDGWIWGASSGGDNRPPPISFDNICPLPKPTLRLPTATQPKLSIALPTGTVAAATATVTSSPAITAQAAPTASASATAVPSSRVGAGGTRIGQYILFGGTVVGLLAAIALAARRRK